MDSFYRVAFQRRISGRYTDDFIIASNNQTYLKELLSRIGIFLANNLRLELHPKKITIRKFQQGIDFLGYILLPYHKMLRAKTRKRLVKRVEKRIGEYKSGLITYKTLEQSLHSCLGVLTHADAHDFSEWLKNQFWFWLTN